MNFVILKTISMNLTFTLNALAYFAVIFMVLLTFRFVRDRNINEAECFQLHTVDTNEEIALQVS